MTDKEIIQALRCCASGESEEECPFTKKYGCDGCPKVSADLIERLTAENAKAEAERDALREKVPRWISVDDRHPKPGTRVLATDGVFVGEAYRTSADTWRRYDGIAMRDCIGSAVTHWMPLAEAPETPEGGEKA